LALGWSTTLPYAFPAAGMSVPPTRFSLSFPMYPPPFPLCPFSHGFGGRAFERCVTPASVQKNLDTGFRFRFPPHNFSPPPRWGRACVILLLRRVVIVHLMAWRFRFFFSPCCFLSRFSRDKPCSVFGWSYFWFTGLAAVNLFPRALFSFALSPILLLSSSFVAISLATGGYGFRGLPSFCDPFPPIGAFFFFLLLSFLFFFPSSFVCFCWLNPPPPEGTDFPFRRLRSPHVFRRFSFSPVVQSRSPFLVTAVR